MIYIYGNLWKGDIIGPTLSPGLKLSSVKNTDADTTLAPHFIDKKRQQLPLVQMIILKWAETAQV